LIIGLLFSKKAPVLKLPPKGFSVQLNSLITAIIGGSYLFGRFLSLFLRVYSFHEIFFMLGTILAYIISFVIYFSFTTVGKPGYLFLALTQPVVAIILYSIYTFQLSIYFFIRAILFFTTCALIFAIPYARGFFQVSNVYKKLTGLGGYTFIRSFVLSMLTDGNDERIESLFDAVGKKANIKIQILFIRNRNSKRLIGIFVIPYVHFGPFKTCGSSIIPELLYQEYMKELGITVFHTTTDHAYNLTTKKEVKKLVDKIKMKITEAKINSDLIWEDKITDFYRDYFKTAKILGFQVDNIPIVLLTRHPYPSDDIEHEVGIKLKKVAQSFQYDDIVAIDAHNAIIDDEVLISPKTEEAKHLIKATRRYLNNSKKNTNKKVEFDYSYIRDPLEEYSERDGIGKGGMILHFFKNRDSNQKIVLIHFDGNNAKAKVRSYILNLLQNRGIDKAEISTSDSHTVARQFTSRGYSPIGDKIKIPYILNKLDSMLKKAESRLEPVEFLYKSCEIKDVRIWGDRKYFFAIMETLQECINVSQRLLSLSLMGCDRSPAAILAALACSLFTEEVIDRDNR